MKHLAQIAKTLRVSTIPIFGRNQLLSRNHSSFSVHGSRTGELKALDKDSLVTEPLAKLDTATVGSQNLLRYNAEHFNTVSLTGVACGDPEIKETRRGEKYTSVVLGQLYRERDKVQSFRVLFWDNLVKIAAERIQQGTTLAVTGYLSGYRNMASVSVQDFYLISPTTSPFSEEQVQKIMSLTSSKREKNMAQASPSKLACYDLFTEQKASAKDIARKRGIKETTVLGYVAEVAATGLNVDWGQLCSEAKLAHSQSVFMTVDEVYASINDTVVDNPDIDVASFDNEFVAKVRGKLQSSAREKFLAQEELGSGMVYSQIRIVIAMVLRGMTPNDWNSFLSEPGEPMRGPF